MMIALNNLLPHLPVFLLVLFRLTGIFVLAPLLGSTSIPPKFRILWTAALAVCIYPVLLAQPASAALITPLLHHDMSLWMLPALMGRELLVGVIIGYGATLAIVGLQIAGQIADQQLGLSLGEVFNPDIGGQISVIGQFYYLLAMMIFILLGGDRIMIRTLLDSFSHIPLGGFVPDGHLLNVALALLGSMFELAVRVSAPLLCLIFLETVAMGFIARTVPQMNILSVGFPVRILLGLAIIIATLSMHVEVFVQAMHNNLTLIARYLAAAG